MNDQFESMYERMRDFALSHRISPMSSEQFTEFLGSKSQDVIAALENNLRLAEQGQDEAINRLLDRILASKMQAGTGLVGMTMQIAMQMIQQCERARLQGMLRAAFNEQNPNAKRDVVTLFNKIKGATPAEASPQSRNSTMPPPPGARSAAQSSSRMTGQASLPPGVRTGRTYSDQAPEQTTDDQRTIRRGNPNINGQVPKYDQEEVFGSNIGMQFSNLPAKNPSEGNTVMLKIAKAKGQSCKQGMNWQDAILFNLERWELRCLVAVLIKRGPIFRSAGHGPKNDKWFQIEQNTGKFAGTYRVTVGQKVNGNTNDIRAVNISNDLGNVLELCYRALTAGGRSEPAWIDRVCVREYEAWSERNPSYQQQWSERANSTRAQGQPNNVRPMRQHQGQYQARAH